MIQTTNNDLLKALNDCATACNACLSACLGEEDVTMMVNCIRLDIDCAAICATTASFIGRSSRHGKHLLKECIEICGLCAAECAQHPMQHCQDCAAACRRCEEACKLAA